MNHSTSAVLPVVLPESGFIFDVGSWRDRLEQLTDLGPARGNRNPLAQPLLLIIILAKLSGEDQPHGMVEWARARLAELMELLPLERGTLPYANTYRAAASRVVEPEVFQRAVSELLHGHRRLGYAS